MITNIFVVKLNFWILFKASFWSLNPKLLWLLPRLLFLDVCKHQFIKGELRGRWVLLISDYLYLSSCIGLTNVWLKETRRLWSLYDCTREWCEIKIFNTTALSCLKLHLINPLQSFPSIVKEMYFIYKLQNHNLKGGHFYIITMHLILLQHLGKYRKQISENCILFYHVVILILPNVWTAKLGNLRTLFHVVSFELLGGYKIYTKFTAWGLML